MATYTIQASVVGEHVQNLQEWGETWGEIQQEIERLGGDIVQAYAVLGDYDFRFTFEADDEEAAMRIAVAVERFGLDTRTHQLVDIERLGDLVEDV